MKISEVVQKLEEAKQEKGDLDVVVKGFDSWGFDDVETIVTHSLTLEPKSGLHGPKYKEDLNKGDGGALVVFVGF